MDTTTSELTVTDPEQKPDAPATPTAGTEDQTQEVVTPASAAASAPAAAPDPAPAPAAPPAAPSRWPLRPSRNQALALAGAFLVGACVCGGVGVAVGAAVFHHGSDRGSHGWGDDRGYQHGRGDKRDDRRGGKVGPVTPVTPQGPSTPAATATPTPTATPS